MMDRDKLGYAILCGPRDVLTYESIQKSNESFLNNFSFFKRCNGSSWN